MVVSDTNTKVRAESKFNRNIAVEGISERMVVENTCNNIVVEDSSDSIAVENGK